MSYGHVRIKRDCNSLNSPFNINMSRSFEETILLNESWHYQINFQSPQFFNQ